jgi:hypothetical protein
LLALAGCMALAFRFIRRK